MRKSPSSIGKFSYRVIQLSRFLGVFIFCVLCPRVTAQNTYSGTSFITGNTEFGNSLTAGNVTVQGNISFQDNHEDYIRARNFFQGSPFTGPDLDWDPSMGFLPNRFQLWSNFTPTIPSIWGNGASWMHSTLDFGDLTYTGTDTPAFNISQQSVSGNLYPAINLTGYDANTTWVWQQDGMNALLYSTPQVMQMSVDGDGNLSVYHPLTGKSITIAPETGQVGVTNSTASLGGANSDGDQFSLSTAVGGITFFNGTDGLTATLTSTNYDALSISIGDHVSAFGENALAVGHGASAPFLGAIVMGTWNNVLGLTSNSSANWVPTEPILVVGNGTDAEHPSNALIIQKNGDVVISASTLVNGEVTINGSITTNGASRVEFSGNTTIAAPQGDIPMARYEDYH